MKTKQKIRKSKPRVIKTRLADKNNAVLTVVGGDGKHCHIPCEQCPWRVDQTGKFPAEAFRISANTAYDQSFHVFGCHMAGKDRPATCAGFLLMNAVNNIGARLAAMRGDFNPNAISDGGLELHESYKAMAIANGVSLDDSALKMCRSNVE